MRSAVILIGLGAAWFARREPNPLRWPDLARREIVEAIDDAREALVDGARAGTRAEHAFDDEMERARRTARS